MAQTVFNAFNSDLSFKINLAVLFLVHLVLTYHYNSYHIYRMNPDGVSYMLIGSHYANWNTELMISGYWAPLFSWILALLMKCRIPEIAIPRIATGISALILTFSSVRLFYSLALPRWLVILGGWIVCFFATNRATTYVTPDLLAAGFLVLALSFLLSAEWLSSRKSQMLAGVVFGLAYLTKSAAFPMNVLIILATGLFRLMIKEGNHYQILKGIGVTFVAMGIFSLPWMTVLSLKYGKPTFSTSGPINHSLHGPRGRQSTFYSFYSLHQPEAGRITSWEDPSVFPQKTWSPFESLEFAKHQWILIQKNSERIWKVLANSFGLYSIGALSILLAFIFAWPLFGSFSENRWSWLLVPALSIVAPYIPVHFAGGDRYIYALYPMMVAAGLGMAWSLRKNNRVLGIVVLIFVSYSFVKPDIDELFRIHKSFAIVPPSKQAWFVLSEKLKGKLGPIAGQTGTDWNCHKALYVAWQLHQPFFGCHSNPSIDEIRQLGIRLFVANRNSKLDTALSKSSDFVDLDSVVFNSGKNTLPKHFRVYERAIDIVQPKTELINKVD